MKEYLIILDEYGDINIVTLKGSLLVEYEKYTDAFLNEMDFVKDNIEMFNLHLKSHEIIAVYAQGVKPNIIRRTVK